MSIDNRCLEIWNAYGDVPKTLALHRDRCIIDLHHFFGQIFECRDQYLGKPENYPRFEEKGNVVEYHFIMPELIGAFLHTYSPEEFADFIRMHLINDTMQAEAFVERIKNCHKNFDIVFYHEFSYINDVLANRHYVRLYPPEIPVKEIDGLILNKYTSRRLRENDYCREIGGKEAKALEHLGIKKLAGSDFFRHRHLNEILDKLREKHPFLAVSPLVGRGPSLFADKERTRPDYLGMLIYYRLSTENHYLMRKE